MAALGLEAGALGAGFGFSAGLLAAADVSDSVSFAAVDSLSGGAVESLAGGGTGLSELAALSELTAFSASVGAVVSVGFGASVGGEVAGADAAGAGVAGALPLGTLLGLAVAGWGGTAGVCAAG